MVAVGRGTVLSVSAARVAFGPAQTAADLGFGYPLGGLVSGVNHPDANPAFCQLLPVSIPRLGIVVGGAFGGLGLSDPLSLGHSPGLVLGRAGLGGSFHVGHPPRHGISRLAGAGPGARGCSDRAEWG